MCIEVNSLAVQWLGLRAFTAECAGSTPGPGTKILQAALQVAAQNQKFTIWVLVGLLSKLMAVTNSGKPLPYPEYALRLGGDKYLGLRAPGPAHPQSWPSRGEAHVDDGLLCLVVMDELRSLQGLLKVVHCRLEVSQLH